MLKTIDLFAGAGGLSYGFEATKRFRIVAAAENNKNAQSTYLQNHSNKGIKMIDNVIGCDFGKLAQEFEGIDVVIGGPPCQGFSNANRQKNHIISMNNSLVKEYFRAIREISPKAFVMENVSMLSSDKHRFFDSYKDHNEVERMGITLRNESIVLSDKDYEGIDCFDALTANDDSCYMVSDELLQLLNVILKNKKNKDGLTKYWSKHVKLIRKEIDSYYKNATHNYGILHKISAAVDKEELCGLLAELEKFVEFQKSFRLVDELKKNEIIYTPYYDLKTNKIIASLKSYSVIDYVNSILGDSYVKDSGEINSLWFGVPQERKRFIMIGIRADLADGVDVKIPQAKEWDGKFVTVSQAISDLARYNVVDEVDQDEMISYKNEMEISEYAKQMRKGSCGVKNHIIPKTREAAQERFNALGAGENFHDLDAALKTNYSEPARTQNSIYRRLDPERPSETVVNVRKSMWVHPTINRAISVREAARLQSFPDRFVFEGTKDSQYQQVGNAVPPLMAHGIARKVLKYLQNNNQINEK